jgi:hypothetical protein
MPQVRVLASHAQAPKGEGMNKPKRLYVPPNRPEPCRYCGNDGSNIIECEHCNPDLPPIKDVWEDMGML